VSVSRLNVPRAVKSHDPSTQSEIQPIGGDGKLNDERIFGLGSCRSEARDSYELSTK